ncbi:MULTISPECIES: glycoside hydrolase family 97 catalytic domain-containing protein [unclassified Microbulbifer]|uniref:glycoside hydrolase family 97 protein n=1 Tax=unclassified Microbulbifer TaxID=2619833 RepID=UPI0027E49C7C|nr:MULTISPECIES: glycoside hydrolase family 97 catalytic domain-containing protein [unclassified Microbulbifer]
MKRILLISVLLLLSACGAEQQYSLHSPDGSLAVTLELNEAGRPLYRIERNDGVVLKPSQLGVVLDGVDLSSGLMMESAGAPTVISDDYTMLHGKRRQISYTANEQVFSFRNAGGAELQIAFRVSDDGVAFQYRFPGQSDKIKVVEGELTSFAFPTGSKAWLQPMAEAQTGWANTNPSYEEHYQIGIDVGETSPSPAGWVFPALFHTPGGWALISEAGMDGNYHASRLQAESSDGEYRIGYPMDAEVFTDGALKAQSTLPFHSPWRFIAIGELSTLVESTLGTDLAEPAVAEMDWVDPGLVTWSWALLKDASVNYQTQKVFIDYAAEMSWPYTLVDADWDRNIGYEKIAELADYAAQKNVRLLLWYNSSGDWNKTEYSPKGALLERDKRRAEFARLQKMGIAGVKIDFFAGDGQSMVAYYRELLEDAADFQLLVNFHGATLPRGLQRTFPNMMTSEAVHGFEMITFMQKSADLAAAHMAMLPFTRNAFDPMDFTPTAFSEIPNIERRTSNGFELALPVLFLSGLQHIAETDEGMAAVPEYVRDYMRAVPVSWDESRFVAGYPGKFAVVARRAGDTWYLAGINGEPEEQQLTMDLSFIGARTGELITDGDNPRSFSRSEVETGGAVSLNMLGLGGFVMKFPAAGLAKN